MRKRDLHVLTTSLHTFTGDDRFRVAHRADTGDWDLRLAFAQAHDSGAYVCQVNTEPKMQLTVQLEVTRKYQTSKWARTISNISTLYLEVGSGWVRLGLRLRVLV